MHEHAPASKENWDTNVFIRVQVQLDVSFLNIHILDKNLSFLFAQLISDIQFFFLEEIMKMENTGSRKYSCLNMHEVR